jgi:hypothetical protein
MPVVRRLARHLFTLAAAVSLVLCVVLAWVIARQDGQQRTALVLPVAGKVCLIRPKVEGRLRVLYFGTVPTQQNPRWLNRNDSTNWLPAVGKFTPWKRLGVEVVRLPMSLLLDPNGNAFAANATHTTQYGTFPVSVLSVTAAPVTLFATLCALPASWLGLRLFARLRRRTARRTGHCPTCGYDLRASPEQCPECGAARVA